MAYINGKEILFSPQIDINAEYETGYNNGHAAGRKAEYDAFWDVYQLNGNVYSAQGMFGNPCWTDKTFYPKHSMLHFTRGDRMFMSCQVTSIKQRLEEQKVIFDFSKATALAECFYYCATTEVPVIDTTNSAGLNYLFGNATNLVTVEKLILNGDIQTAYNDLFLNCHSLVNIRIGGTIKSNGLDFQYSKNLSKASIESIIEALDEKIKGKSITLSKTAVDTAFYDSNKDRDGSESAEWETLIGERSNWTINLV